MLVFDRKNYEQIAFKKKRRKISMTKAELVAKMAEKTGATKAETDKMVNAFITTVRENLQNGGTVKLVGFFSGHYETQKSANRR